MNNLNKEVITLPPFKRFCMSIGELPTSYLESMTYYESLLWFTKYLKDTVIPTINNNGLAVEELQTKYVELVEYVNNYFDNLDIQTEIDNKLDDMAEQGQLAEIIAQYLEISSVLGFDTKSALKGAENIVSGSICKTIGDLTYNDGKGNYYKIRDLEEGDVIDDDELVALTNFETLVAEKLPDYRMNQVESAITTLNNTTIPNIETQIADIQNRKWIFVGDSYSQGYNPDGNVTGWSTVLKGLLGLDNDHCIIADYGGAGFSTSTSHPYEDIIDGLTADEDVTDILFAGGYNDLQAGSSSIGTGMSNCMTLIGTKFPNANVYAAFIGGSKNAIHGNIYLAYSYYVNNCNSNNIVFLPNTELCLYDASLFASDGIHLTQTGQNTVANALYQALNGGYNYCKYSGITLNTSGYNFNSSTYPLNLYSNNDISYFSNSNARIALSATEPINVASNGNITIGKLSQNGLIGIGYTNNQTYSIGNVIVRDSSKYYNIEGRIRINTDGELILSLNLMANAANDDYLNNALTAVTNIQIPTFCINIPTITL